MAFESPFPFFDASSNRLSEDDILWAAALSMLWAQPKTGSRTVSKQVEPWLGRNPREWLPHIEGVDIFWQLRFEALVEKIRAIEEPWQLIQRRSANYPAALEELDHPPACLFVRGDTSLLTRPSFAIVGTRKPSEEGVRRARRLARALSERGVGVTSGLAEGIDTAAHAGALDVNGKTIAVIGTPLDKTYPAANRKLQEAIVHYGLVVSQFPFFAPIDRGNFPERNRTMAAIAGGTCVVEAGPTSGTRHQVTFSLRIKHPVYFMRSMIEDSPAPWVRAAMEQGALVLSEPSELDSLFGL